MHSLGWIELAAILIIFVVFLPLTIIPYWKIFSKAGWNGALSLLMMLPLVSLILLWVFAFSDWPTLRERRQ